MKTQEIQSLVDRYLAAESTPEEERRLALTLHEAAKNAGDDLPDDWQAVRLMLGELTLGEALYDDIISRRRRRPFFWRWAAVAAFVLTAGLGVALYHSASLQRPADDTSLTHETRPSTQSIKATHPVASAHTSSRIVPHVQSYRPTRPVASSHTYRRKRKTVQPMIMPSVAENPSLPQEELAEEPLLAAAEAEQQTEDIRLHPLSPDEDSYAYIEAEMCDIRSRGERVEAMVAKLTGPVK